MKKGRAYAKGFGKIFCNSLFFRNPVLIGALGLFPVAAAGYSVRNAEALSLLFVCLAFPTGILFCLVGKCLPQWIRPGAVLAASAAVYIPAARLTESLLPGSVTALGVAGALMVCNSIIVSRAEGYAPGHIWIAVIADAAGCSAGFASVIFLSAVLREWMAGGPWGMDAMPSRAGVTMPFAGFLLLGFFAAFVQWANGRRVDRALKKRAG